MPDLTAEHAQELMGRLVAECAAEVDAAKSLYVQAVAAHEADQSLPQLNGQRRAFERVLLGLETVGHDLDHRVGVGNLQLGLGEQPWHQLLWPAYRLRRTMTLLPHDGTERTGDALAQAYDEALDGLPANRQPELRLHLVDMPLDEAALSDVAWDGFLEHETRRAFLLLVRKRPGDIERSLGVIDGLRRAQAQREPELQEQGNEREVYAAAARALALYNCAKAIELTGRFLSGEPESRRGRRPSPSGTSTEIDHFIFNAREVLSGIDVLLRKQVARLGKACGALINASVYAQVLPPSVRRFVTGLARRHEKPVLELWYAQRQAIQQRLLDPTRRAVVVSLPTSSGKTLLAEMAVLQAHHDAPENPIVYVAPTRALVTQASLTLKRDLGPAGIRVRVASPTFELDSVEKELLEGGEFDVLVTTPEKLDLLVKLNHASIADLSLVVVDEAHTIADEERGARLELLLGTLRREQGNCRFLLLTPFANNAADIARWLGEDNGASVVLDWKPNDRVVGVLGTKKPPRRPRRLFFETLDTPHSDCPGGIRLQMGQVGEENVSRRRLALWATEEWADTKRGGVLLLATSRRGAVDRAKEIAGHRRRGGRQRDVDLVRRYLETEAGGVHPLSPLLAKGVAFHHAGLSPDARYLVERLVEHGRVSALCATTTLAHGVHFPLSAVVIESCYRRRKKRGRWSSTPIEPWEFWNIVGRAGRAMEDALGVVALAAPRKKDVECIRDVFLARDAGQVVSALMKTLGSLGGQEVHIGLDLIDQQPALSAFLQYLLHAVSVGGETAARRDVELLLRSSFVFSEAQRVSPELADELVRLARRYLDQLVAAKGDSLAGFAKIADGTGFSSPSVDQLWSEWRGTATIEEWHTDTLYAVGKPPCETLTKIMATLGRVPEVRLGDKEDGVFSPERVARITSLWVNGRSLTEIARLEYDDDLLECCRHLYTAVTSLVPWGMGAIQRVAFAGEEDVNWSELEMLPAMVLHGVKTRNAIGLRMLNVPRFVSEGMARRAEQAGVALGALDSWLDSTSDDDWRDALPSRARITGAECKRVWRVLDGRATWDELAH